MGQLHELLAVEPDAKGRFAKIVTETMKTLKDKANLFKGKLRELKMFDSSPEKAVEMRAIEEKDRVFQAVETTVYEILNYCMVEQAVHLDIQAQKDATNQQAKADVIVDGVTILKDVPGVTLLTLEAQFKILRAEFEEIPTLAPGINWAIDTNHAKRNVFKSETVYDIKTKEDTDFKSIGVGDKFPNQVMTLKSTFNIGQYSTTDWSAMMHSSTKAALLERLDILDKAVKQARQRANKTEIVPIAIGDSIMKFLAPDWYNRENRNPGQ